jgi:beta-RFAP synthase
MNIAQTTITAPSRLHFGLFGLGGSLRAYGGVGAMVRQPETRIEISPAEQFTCSGEHAQRAREFAQLWFAHQTRLAGVTPSANTLAPAGFQDCQRLDELPCRLQITAPKQHVGLGVGTQLALAVASSLTAHFQQTLPAIAELALSMKRGGRSAVGSYGFAMGGMIVDGGRSPDAAFAELSARFAIPESWRFILIRPDVDHDLFGRVERRVFDRLAPLDDKLGQQLVEVCQQGLVPAITTQDFGLFTDSLTRFNFLSGSIFAEVQGGAYHGPTITQLIENLQQAGLKGVGQSSWGPTLFAMASTPAEAEEVQQVAASLLGSDGWSLIAQPDNRGHRLQVG